MKLWIHVTIALVSFMTVGGILFSQFHRLNHLPLEVEFAEQVLRARAFKAKETQIALDLNDRYQRSPLNKTVDDIRRKILELTASNTKWATEAEECQKTQVSALGQLSCLPSYPSSHFSVFKCVLP